MISHLPSKPRGSNPQATNPRPRTPMSLKPSAAARPHSTPEAEAGGFVSWRWPSGSFHSALTGRTWKYGTAFHTKISPTRKSWFLPQHGYFWTNYYNSQMENMGACQERTIYAVGQNQKASTCEILVPNLTLSSITVTSSKLSSLWFKGFSPKSKFENLSECKHSTPCTTPPNGFPFGFPCGCGPPQTKTAHHTHFEGPVTQKFPGAESQKHYTALHAAISRLKFPNLAVDVSGRRDKQMSGAGNQVSFGAFLGVKSSRLPRQHASHFRLPRIPPFRHTVHKRSTHFRENHAQTPDTTGTPNGSEVQKLQK